MIAVVPVRQARLAAGGSAAVEAAGGRVLLIGEGVRDAAPDLEADVVELRCAEAGAYAPRAWSGWLARELASEHGVVLPGSPDGRDLLGALATAMGRPAHAWCQELTASTATSARHDGRQLVGVPLGEPFVATVVSRGAPGRSLELPEAVTVPYAAGAGGDARLLGTDAAAPEEVELAEASRIVAGGLGCGGASGLADLARVARAIGASLGVTRPVADRGDAPHARQIGTTGVAVSPELYLAFGISGAVQHTAAIGAPRHVVAVNVDASCPMMQLADLAVVADAPATLAALAEQLGAP